MAARRMAGLALVGIVLSPLPAKPQSAYSPPPVGTQVTWVAETAEGRQTRVSEVVATGRDFAIHLYDLTWDASAPYSYFAEFSGLHLVSCASAMPDPGARARLQGFWPLTSGRSLSMADEYNSTYIVGETRSYALSQADGPKPAQHVTAVVGENRTDFMLSLEWHTPVQVGLADGAGDSAIEVFSPGFAASSEGLDRRALGRCASLLDEAAL